jgi:hypothetical protein
MNEEAKPKIYLNPPPADRKCMRCKKDLADLKPFGGAGDPLVGDFKGALLLKTFRSMYEGPPIEEYDEIIDKMYYNSEEDNNMEALRKEYGEDMFNSATLYAEMSNQVSASWECRECIIK